MKKLLFLFVATASLLVSCSKDDDNSTPDNSAFLHGKWEAKSFESSFTINGNPINDENVDIELDGVVGTIFEFNSNNTFKVTSYDDFDETWYTDEGTYVYNQALGEISMTYTDDFSDVPEVVKMKVLSLTSSNFKFRLQEIETDEDGEFVFTLDVNCDKMNN